MGHYLIMMYPVLLVIHLFLAAQGLPCCMWAFSSCNKQELLCCGLWALGLRASVAVRTGLVASARELWGEGPVVVAHRLSCPVRVGSSQIRSPTRIPCVGRQRS